MYEIRSIIKRNFREMCSDSPGSIQAALKKLLAGQMVVFSEHVEKGVNKKRYSITGKGRKEFMAWLQIPADAAASKNMELGKFLFMGLLPEEKRLPIIGKIIQNLEAELSVLTEIWDSMQGQSLHSRNMAIEYWKNDPEYLAGVIGATGNPDLTESANGIGDFEVYTLQYGMDNLRFHIDWFSKLQKKIENGEEGFFSVKNKEDYSK